MDFAQLLLLPSAEPTKQGYNVSHRTARAHRIASTLAETYPAQYETWYYWDTPQYFHAYIVEKMDPVPFPDHLKGHSSSPFVWFETGPDKIIQPIGGLSDFRDWCV